MSFESFIGTALEACTTCMGGSSSAAPDGKVVNGYDGKNDPKAIRNTGHSYHDGDGVHDTVMIKGPLSEAFTKALNIKLKKKPLQPVEDKPNLTDNQEQVIEQNAEEKNPLLKQHSSEKIGIATESEQIDSSNLQYMIREFDQHSAEINFVANKFDFLTPEQLPRNVACQCTLISMTDFMSPSKVCELLEDTPNSRSQKVLVVVSDALGTSAGVTTQERLVDIHYTGGEYANLKQNPEFNLAVEDHFAPAGFKVVIGIEGFFAFLEDFYNAKQ
jgi:hypothetical protein